MSTLSDFASISFVNLSNFKRLKENKGLWVN